MSAGSTLAMLATKCAARVFDLSSDLRNVSIRDQVVRAQLLVRELLQEPECQRVLVVGAGVSGVTAAVALAAAKREVLVVETNAAPLSLQGACDWRYVGPFMYEWPSHFFDDQAYPPSGTGWPAPPPSTPQWPGPALSARPPLDPLTAADLAAHLGAWLKRQAPAPAVLCGVDPDAVQDYVKDFVAYWEAQHLSPATSPPRPALNVQRLGGSLWCGTRPALDDIEIDYVVLAAGMGNENTTLNDRWGKPAFTARRFWLDRDDLREPTTADQQVAVLGGGDGALQDVLRALTHFDHPLQMWHFLRSGRGIAASPDYPTWQADKTRQALDDLLPELAAIEQQHRLVAMWDPTRDSARAQVVDQACEALAQRAARQPDVEAGVLASLRSGTGCVTHLMREQHFGKAYLLNRFLVHLIEACQGPNVRHLGRMSYRLLRGCDVAWAQEHHGPTQFEISYQLPGHAATSAFFDQVAVRFGVSGVPARQLVTLSKDDEAWRTSLSGLQLPFVVPD